METNESTDIVTHNARIEMVDEKWINDQKGDIMIRETEGMFDEGYIKGFIEEQCEDGVFSKHGKECEKKYNNKRINYRAKVDRAEQHDQPNTWVDIAVMLNRGSIKCQGQALMVMGLTEGPCHKCFSIWHATKNHNRKNCKRCGRTGHFSKDCNGVQMILSEYECR